MKVETTAPMKIAVLCPKNLPYSSMIYLDNITGEINKAGHTVLPFLSSPLPQNADIYWQPSAGRNGPDAIFEQAKAPVVITFHGAANLALPLSMCFGARFRSRWNGWKSRLKTLREWRSRSRYYDQVITVSDYAKKEAEEYLKIPGHLITPIYHGVDHEAFYPIAADTNTQPYLLHVSAYQPKKNLERIIAAYNKISNQLKPRFIIVAPGYNLSGNYGGIELIRKPMNNQQIALLYQNALGFIFPSLHETFGMPIIEAMACGCPVITSIHPGCSEVAGNSALIVNPYSVEEITNAMEKLITDLDLRKTLRNKGIERALQFTWAKSAGMHMEVFEAVINNTKNRKGPIE